MTTVLAGMALGFSLILAIGPQNLLVLKVGIKKTGIGAVVIVCILSDMILFSAGALGVGGIISHVPAVMDTIRYAGAAYLFWFAATAARDAFFPKPAGTTLTATEPPRRDAESGVPTSRGGVAVLAKTRPAKTATTRPEWVQPVLAALMMTWLNPGAYVDSLVMVGGIANQYVGDERYLFVAGCLCASVIWFPVLGFGARALSTPLSSPRVWRGINLSVAVILSFLAIKLLTM